MKFLKKHWGKLLLALLGLLVVLGLWFTRPMTLATMFPGFDPAGVSQMSGSYTTWNDEGLGFTQGSVSDLPSEEFQALFQTLTQVKFRRDIWGNLYTTFSRSYSGKDKIPLNYSLYLSFYGDGDSGGDLLSLEYFHGWFSFSYYPAGERVPRQRWFCSLKGNEKLIGSFLDLVKTHEAQNAE